MLFLNAIILMFGAIIHALGMNKILEKWANCTIYAHNLYCMGMVL